ncbi:hypothetical protein P154DRAFT_540757 [Amniculicola lignicola CBS 123094]|uniref:Uncharacterized protein n=1 Tax=Amniculicola lignicola CBS 123094 TaxID=1392246 RepID=A0A6A5W1J2_9PLEO|nr:hypothetical protein P154DRAFT_540757 [Amniculicola lignicola CBS 123094]
MAHPKDQGSAPQPGPFNSTDDKQAAITPDGPPPQQDVVANNAKPDFIAEMKSHLLSKGQLDFYNTIMPQMEQLYFEDTPKNKNSAIAPRRLFLGEGDGWTMWAYIRTFKTSKSGVDLVLEKNDAEGNITAEEKLPDVNGYTLMYPFQTFVGNSRERSLIKMKILIKVLFYENGVNTNGNIFQNNLKSTFLLIFQAMKDLQKEYARNGFLDNLPPVYRPGTLNPTSPARVASRGSAVGDTPQAFAHSEMHSAGGGVDEPSADLN